MRIVQALVLSAFAISPLLAQEVETPWRETVDGQIEAFRTGDAEAALEFAGAGFKRTYDDPERFLADVERAGYAPIVSSRSHSFGSFEAMGETTVVQIVKLVGPDHSLYEAAYQLANEPGEGWRVQAVIMRKLEGMGI
jgi:hypothetical protein